MASDTQGFPSFFQQWSQILLDLVLPPHCAGCGKLGSWLCADCAMHLPRIQPPLCRVCGTPTLGLVICAECWNRRRYTEEIRTPFFYDGVLRSMIHRLKYRRARYLALPLGELMAQYFCELPWNGIDCLVAVPLHENRKHDRGYNQARLLADVISAKVGIPVLDNCIERVRDTSAQMGLPANKRLSNMKQAFSAERGLVTGKHIVLIDDVCTTTATMESCAQSLRKAGAKRVYGLALARARLRRNMPMHEENIGNEGLP